MRERGRPRRSTVATVHQTMRCATAVKARLAADGFDDLRFGDGVVFQHLVEGRVTVTVLAERLGVTQQAASKAVADLERRGYVRRVADPADARARLVELTARGRGAVSGARRHRAAVRGGAGGAAGAAAGGGGPVAAGRRDSGARRRACGARAAGAASSVSVCFGERQLSWVGR